MKDSSLIIFVKNPEIGKVKTRLAKTIGDEEALKIYQRLLDHTHAITKNLTCNKKLYFSSFIDNEFGWNEGYESKLQAKGDLGQKMKLAIKSELSKYQKVIIIGSDCAELNQSIIVAAFEALNDNDFVIGPANDGGYYLLGMKKLNETLFDDMAWSTESILTDTIERVQTAKQSYFLLPELIDVDSEMDWLQVKNTFEKH